MKKRIVAILLIAVLSVSLLTACQEKKAITQEEAQQVAIAHAGLSASDVQDAHIHVSSDNGIPCYSVHITKTDGSDFSVLINAATGEVIG